MRKKLIGNYKYDFLVFGAGGMQGQIVVKDLVLKKYKVFVSDLSEFHIENIIKKFPFLNFQLLDLQDVEATINLIKKVKPAVVINCAEADWNLNVYRACLKTKTNVIDLGSDIPMTKYQLKMDKLFKKNGIIAITGCGSTPGINNVMLNYALNFFDTVKEIKAGFVWNSTTEEFVPPFSIPSITEEFTEKASILKRKKWIKVDPLKRIVVKRFKDIGSNRCFFVRHPEPFTFYYYYKERGIKDIKFYAGFPNHSFYTIYNFIKLGLTSKQEININGERIIPLNFLTEVLRTVVPSKKYKENEILWVLVYGEKDGRKKVVKMEAFTRTLRGWESAGCNIDTGIPASLIAQMIRNKEIQTSGSFAPEAIVSPLPFFKKLRERGIKIYMNNELIN
jgi:saccharopine dehydrogenase-like NADP-dependent oxidoreductase